MIIPYGYFTLRVLYPTGTLPYGLIFRNAVCKLETYLLQKLKIMLQHEDE